MAMREKVRAAKARTSPFGREPDPLDRYGSFSFEGVYHREFPKLRKLVGDGMMAGCCHQRPVTNGNYSFVVAFQNTCLTPVLLRYTSLWHPQCVALKVRRYSVDLLVRCKRCGPCLKARSFVWGLRAQLEEARSAVTWHGNVTLNPFQHAELDAGVARRNRELGTMPDWSVKTLFQKRCAVFSEWLTLWLHNVRQYEERRRIRWNRSEVGYAADLYRPCEMRPRFRYLLVAEEHNSEKTSEFLRGRPHWHILLHEPVAEELVHSDEYHWVPPNRYHDGEWRIDDGHYIKRLWHRGYTQFKMVTDPRQAIYTCKYLSEDMLWRVRASHGYGVDLTEEANDKGTLTSMGEVATSKVLSAAESGVRGEEQPEPAAQQVRAAKAQRGRIGVV